MRLVNVLILLMIGLLVSCVQLPDLLPNGSGNNSDMVIVELNEILGSTEIITVNDSIDLEFDRNEIETCGDLLMKITGGNILALFDNNTKPVELTEGDLVGGFVEGVWSNRVILYSGMQFFPGCVNLPNITSNEDVVAGIKFKTSANKTHFGWVVLNVDSNTIVTLKAIGYNKQPGVNVRIGN
jgi:hypothetical protein